MKIVNKSIVCNVRKIPMMRCHDNVAKLTITMYVLQYYTLYKISKLK